MSTQARIYREIICKEDIQFSLDSTPTHSHPVSSKGINFTFSNHTPAQGRDPLADLFMSLGRWVPGPITFGIVGTRTRVISVEITYSDHSTVSKRQQWVDSQQLNVSHSYLLEIYGIGFLVTRSAVGPIHTWKCDCILLFDSAEAATNVFPNFRTDQLL